MSLRILMTAYDYRPRLGGVATCGFEIARALSRTPGVELRVLSRRSENPQADLVHDARFGLDTRRVPLPAIAANAILPLSAAVARECLSWRPHAVLNLLWLPSGVSTWMLAPLRAALRIPYFVMAHGVEVVETSGSFKKDMRRNLSFVKSLVLSNATAVFPVSRFTRDLVLTQSPGAHCVTLHNGVWPDEFYPEPKPQPLVERHGLAGKKVLLTIARLEDYKGIDRAIGAMRHVVRDCPEAVYLVCGEGKDLERLEAIVRLYRLQKHVIFAGKIPQESLRDYINLCDVFVLLTREDMESPNFEGFGIVFLEAAGCAKPAIGGRSGGIPDAVSEGETGWLVDPTDDNAIANVMLEALLDSGKRERYGRQARERALTSFGWNHVAEKLLAEVRKHVRN